MFGQVPIMRHPYYQEDTFWIIYCQENAIPKDKVFLPDEYSALSGVVYFKNLPYKTFMLGKFTTIIEKNTFNKEYYFPVGG